MQFAHTVNTKQIFEGNEVLLRGGVLSAQGRGHQLTLETKQLCNNAIVFTSQNQLMVQFQNVAILNKTTTKH